MASQLSGIAVILFIAFGSLIFILLFIFAKRQITRFALKSRRGPHVAVGIDAPKHLRLEIERRLDRIDKIICEPWLLKQVTKDKFENQDVVADIFPPHIYRMKVVDDMKELSYLIKATNISLKQQGAEDILHYFLRIYKMGAMCSINAQMFYKFLKLYEDARHEPCDFAYHEYCEFQELLQLVKNSIIQTADESKPECSSSKSVDKYFDEQAKADESTKPLLIKTLSYLSSSTRKKFTHETSV